MLSKGASCIYILPVLLEGVPCCLYRSTKPVMILTVDGPFERTHRQQQTPLPHQAHLYSRSSADLPVTSPSVATMSARSGAISADTAAHPAMAVLCKGDVGRCPSYSTLLVAGPDAVCLALPVESRREPSRRRIDARMGRISAGRITSLLLLLQHVIVAAVTREKCELRDAPAERAHQISGVVIFSLEIVGARRPTQYYIQYMQLAKISSKNESHK